MLPSYDIEDPDQVPAPMPEVEEGGYDIVNILLLGSDTENPRNAGRTDVMVVVSVNRTAGTVSFLSIPRDLYVYIPGERVYRINSAFGYGQQRDGQGIALLSETIQYNLGLTVDFYARVDFRSFRDIVDSLGGVDVPVDCAIEDWRLKEDSLDPAVEENWEMFSLPVGIYHFDGSLALWYARSRRTTSDFDRGRRHQALLRSMWRRVQELGLVQQVAELWPEVSSRVTTDLSGQDILGLLPVATSLDSTRIRQFVLRQGHEVQPWSSPEGSSVLVPDRRELHELLENMYLPATDRQLVRETPRILIVNASGFRALAQVAADRLAWEGFEAIISEDSAPYQEQTSLIDYSGRSKGGSLGKLISITRLNEADVSVEIQAGRAYDFQLTLGGMYSACTYDR
ncbi:MAG: LCP family protein [Chloroflexi bacterium]|nr:LCP family protein [Chloroflexota bacterium]